jgi:copper resistance protein B
MNMRIDATLCVAVLLAGSAGAGERDMPMGGHDIAVGHFGFDRLESRQDGDHALDWEAEGWYGTDARKVVFKSRGSREAGGPTMASETQLLYRASATAFFDWQAGLRYDDQPGPSRSYAVLGMQGLAPQWFEVNADLFVSERGDPSLRLELENELPLTRRLFLAPKLEYNLALGDDRDLNVGAGGSGLEVGLRLRYRVTPAFEPYLGYEWEKRYGRTGDWLREAGEGDEEGAWVAGVRFWF